MCEIVGGRTAHEICVKLLDQYDILLKDLCGKEGIQGEYIRIAVKDER